MKNQSRCYADDMTPISNTLLAVYRKGLYLRVQNLLVHIRDMLYISVNKWLIKGGKYFSERTSMEADFKAA